MKERKRGKFPIETIVLRRNTIFDKERHSLLYANQWGFSPRKRDGSFVDGGRRQVFPLGGAVWLSPEGQRGGAVPERGAVVFWRGEGPSFVCGMSETHQKKGKNE